MDKKSLRQEIRGRKSEHSAEECRLLSEAICRDIMSDGAYRASGVVLMYHALADEVSLQLLLDHALLMGKRVLLPVVQGDVLVLRRYTGPGSLKVGAFGILEPSGPDYPLEEYVNIDLALVPGMAFDSYGNRLGRGKGYYDRLLPQLVNAHKIGVCYPFQMVDRVPCEDHDMKVMEVVNSL